MNFKTCPKEENDSKKKLVFRPIRVKVIPRKNLCRLFSPVSGLTYSRWFEKRMSKVACREEGSPSSPLHGSRWEEAGRLENRFKPPQLILTFSFRFAKFPDSFPPPRAYQEGIRRRILLLSIRKVSELIADKFLPSPPLSFVIILFSLFLFLCNCYYCYCSVYFEFINYLNVYII